MEGATEQFQQAPRRAAPNRRRALRKQQPSVEAWLAWDRSGRGQRAHTSRHVALRGCLEIACSTAAPTLPLPRRLAATNRTAEGALRPILRVLLSTQRYSYGRLLASRGLIWPGLAPARGGRCGAAAALIPPRPPIARASLSAPVCSRCAQPRVFSDVRGQGQGPASGGGAGMRVRPGRVPPSAAARRCFCFCIACAAPSAQLAFLWLRAT